MEPVDGTRSKRGRRLGVAALVAAVVALGLGATLAVSSRLAAGEQTRTREAVVNAGDSFVASLRVALAEVDGQATAAASLLATAPSVSQQEFDRFVDRLGPLPGTLGTGYAALVPQGDLAEFEARIRASDPAFSVFRVDALGGTVPDIDDEAHVVLVHLASTGTGSALQGLCLASGSAQLASIDAALNSDDLVLSPFLRFPGENDDDGLLAYRRVPAAEDEDAALVVVPLDLGQMMAARGFGGQWQWQITDLTSGQAVGPTAPASGQFSYVNSLYFGYRAWRIEVSPVGRAAPALPILQQWVVLLVGVVVSLIAGGVVWATAARTTGRREERRLRAGIAAKDRFLASVSHELRTPLAGIIGFLAAMPDADRLSPEQAEHIAIAREQSWELTSLVEDLLTGTRSDSELLRAAPAAIDLSEEVSHLLATLGRDLRAQIADVGGAGWAYANPTRVRQILRNLIDNGAKHGMPPIDIAIAGDGEWASVEVVDRGPGLAPEQVPRLFAPYQSMHASSTEPDNIGLGLWLSRRLARLMGGDLTYERRQGLTVFTLRLVGIAPPPAQPPTAPPSEAATAGTRGKAALRPGFSPIGSTR
jgi:signal transduction histidine kinase